MRIIAESQYSERKWKQVRLSWISKLSEENFVILKNPAVTISGEKFRVIRERLTKILQKNFRNPNLEIGPEDSAEDIPGWDSLANIQLILSLEKEFEIRFSSSEVLALRTIADLILLISSKIEL